MTCRIAAGAAIVILTVATASAACRDGSPGADAPVRPDATSSAIVSDVSAKAPPPAPVAAEVPGKLDMDAIFPPGEGRDLVLNNCMTCHSFIRFVLLRRTHDQWAYVRRRMRPYVSNLDEAEADALFGYLESHFNDTKPEPAVPQWFLDAAVW